MAVGSRAVNIRRFVNIHLNCIRSELAERYNSANIDRLAQPIGHSCRYRDVRSNYLIDVGLAAPHCGNYYYSLAAAPAHGLVGHAMAGLACVVDIFGLDAAAPDHIGHASVQADQLVVHVLLALQTK